MPTALWSQPAEERIALGMGPLHDSPLPAASPSDVVARVADLLASPAADPVDLPGLVCEALVSALPVERVALLAWTRGGLTVLGAAGVDIADVADPSDDASVACHAPRLLGGRIDAPHAGIEDDTLLVVPVLTCDRRLGVLLADRDGAPLALEAEHLDDLRAASSSIGVALAACRVGIRRERTLGHARRLDLVRELHDGVIQRLFAVSTLLGSQTLDQAERERCRQDLSEAAAELRRTVWQHVAGEPARCEPTVAEEVAALQEAIRDIDIRIDPAILRQARPAHRPLVERMLVEGLRNARKHSLPTRVVARLWQENGTVVVEVRNDGACDDGSQRGLGLRLLGIDAVHHGGLLEAGRDEEGWWRLTLTLPAAD